MARRWRIYRAALGNDWENDLRRLEEEVDAWRSGEPLDLPRIHARHLRRDSTRAAIAGVHHAIASLWRLEGIIRLAPTGDVVEELIVAPWDAGTDDAGDVTGQVLRGLPIAEIRNRAMARLRLRELAPEAQARVDALPPDDAKRRAARDEMIARPAHALPTEKAPLKRGPQGYPASHYERLAYRYLELVGAGRRDVLRALVDEESQRLGRAIPYQTIRGQIRRCVQLEYLAPASKQGRAGVRPGPNLPNSKEEERG